jgi:tRNA threonylcarbamoyladenosine biosynthesis protein TsaE
MTIGAFVLLAFVLGIVAYDWVSLRGKNRRAVLLEMAAFLVGAVFIAFPDRATALAHAVGIGRGLDCATPVTSPSFVLMNEYDGRETLFHVDLYRIEDVEELDELGLWDYAERGVLVIEWPERGAELLPGDGLVIELRYGDRDRQRRLRFLPRGTRGAELVQSLGVA